MSIASDLLVDRTGTPTVGAVRELMDGEGLAESMAGAWEIQ